MHPNPHFRQTGDDENAAFVRARGFGVLAINGSAEPLTASIPALLSEDKKTLEFHLLRSNPIAAAINDPHPAIFLVNGPDAYISPDWYGIDDQVPTWNYVAVKISGTVRRLEDGALKGVLDRLSAAFEERLAPKPPWRSDKMTPGVMDRMMRAIVPFALDIETIDGTWKLGQNKPEAVRHAAADALSESSIGLATDEIAALMGAERR